MTKEEFQAKLPELAGEYQPADDVLEHIGNVALLMTIGPSGVGKTSVMKKLGLPYVPSDTTRVRRSEETDGVDYHFRSDYENIIEEIRGGRFVQIAVGPAGDMYATRDTSYPESGLATMAVVADVVPIFRKLGFEKTISAFITPPNYDQWMQRIGSHHLEGNQLKKRLAEAKRSLSAVLGDKETHFVLNDNLEQAVKQTTELLEGKIDVDRQIKAKVAAQAILDRLD